MNDDKLKAASKTIWKKHVETAIIEFDNDNSQAETFKQYFERAGEERVANPIKRMRDFLQGLPIHVEFMNYRIAALTGLDNKEVEAASDEEFQNIVDTYWQDVAKYAFNYINTPNYKTTKVS